MIVGNEVRRKVRCVSWALSLGLAIALGVSPCVAEVAAVADRGAAVAGAYRLGAGDQIRVLVFGEPTLSGDFIVSDTGSVELPLVGSIKAAGLTIRDLQAEATKTFADGYVNNPRVTVEVLKYRPYYILGEVNKPGEYEFAAGMTVLNAVAAADGFTYRSNTKVVMVKHEGEATDREVELKPSTVVQPGDTIRIRERIF